MCCYSEGVISIQFSLPLKIKRRFHKFYAMFNLHLVNIFVKFFYVLTQYEKCYVYAAYHLQWVPSLFRRCQATNIYIFQILYFLPTFQLHSQCQQNLFVVLGK